MLQMRNHLMPIITQSGVNNGQIKNTGSKMLNRSAAFNLFCRYCCGTGVSGPPTMSCVLPWILLLPNV